MLALLGEGLEEHRPAAQVAALHQALQAAHHSRGARWPVLAVGRDGVTLCEYRHRVYEVATMATVTIFDRAGKRLLTHYVACVPELGQATLSRQLTSLLSALLAKWDGPLPTLAYVSDSGGNESSYFDEVLRRMRHPRTGQRLWWERVVDFYHASQRAWTTAEALFGAGTPRYYVWARRMLHRLKHEPRGSKCVLHSAATLAKRLTVNKTRRKLLRTAYEYLRKRTRWMRYQEYKRRHIPLGSGITEAACKTVYTQRLKLSGMRWTRDGAQRILTLRTILLSQTWNVTFANWLAAQQALIPAPYVPGGESHARIAA